jgi:ribulose-phosphate 3-epimerase
MEGRKVRKVIPSVLTSVPEDLEKKVRILEPLIEVIQIDIMDGKFVPNTSVAVGDVQKVSPQVPMEVHLMVEHPGEYVQPFADIGAFRIIFHIESDDDAGDVIQKIRQLNMEPGVALNPPTPVEEIKPFLNLVDIVLVMGVNPGFQGQKFIPEVLTKVRAVKQIRPELPVEVDGGVNPETGPALVDAGVDILNVGSYLFKQLPVADNWRTMQKIIGSE